MKKRKENKNSKLKGFGGWFIIPLLNVLIYGIFSLFIIGVYLLYGIASPVEGILFLTSLGGLLFTYYLCTLMFAKSKKFPKLFIWWLWITLALNIIDSGINADYTSLGAEIIFNIIWTRYAQVSIRVKNTFVNK